MGKPREAVEEHTRMGYKVPVSNRQRKQQCIYITFKAELRTERCIRARWKKFGKEPPGRSHDYCHDTVLSR